MSNFIDSLQLSGTNYSLKDPNATNVTSVTQAEYDALVTGGTLDPTVMYIISDAQPVDISQYWTSAETNSAINEATSGKLDTSVYTAYTAATDTALANKVETSAITTAVTTASTDSEIPTAKAVNDAIAAGGGGGGSVTVDPTLDSGSTNPVANSAITNAINDKVSIEDNEVPESWVYYTATRYITMPYEWYIKTVTLEASSAKTGYTSVNGQIGIFYEDYGENDYTNFNLNYVTKTVTSDTQDYVTITYNDDIEDFQFTVVSNSFDIISLGLNQDIKIKAGMIPIASGQSANVIKEGIEPAIGEVMVKTYNAVDNFWFDREAKYLKANWSKPNGNNGETTISFADDITFKDNKLATNILVPTTQSGWTEIQIDDGACDMYNINCKPIFRFTYKNSRPSYLQFQIMCTNGDITSYDRLTWDDGNQEYTFYSDYFDGQHSGFSAATYVYDSTAKTITVTYPLTAQDTGWESPKNVFLHYLYTSDCDFGYNITVDYYDTLKMDIATYAQTKQDILSAGTGIDITNNVISVTGGGGGSSYTAGYGIDIDTANTISVTGQVASSAITTAVTTASTDSEIPTAKAVNDAIAAGGGGGGGTTYSAGTNISISNDTINCTLPITATSNVFDTISVGTGSGGGAYNTMIGPNARCDNNNGHNVFLVAQNSSSTSEKAYVNGTYNVIIGTIKGGYPNFNIQSFNTSRSVVIGGGGISTDKDNSVAIGYQANVSGTTKTNINNQLKIDTSNQIYIMDKTNTNEICLQDYLGGGGTVDQTVVSGSTNAVAGGAVYDQLGGMKIVKLTESEYAALVTKDLDTLYVVIPDPSN